MSLATLPMPKKQPNYDTEKHCTYTNVKIDDRVLPLVRAAAALSDDAAIQDYISDVLNEIASKKLRLKPVARRLPPPKPHGKGRPPRKPA